MDGPPVSQQTRRRDRLTAWKKTVRQEAEKYWSPGHKTATDVLVRKVNLSGSFTVENMTPTLTEGFSRENEFLHIVVIDASEQEVII